MPEVSTREEVYKAIDGERDYQGKWDRDNPGHKDADEAVAFWIICMEQYIQKAKVALTKELNTTQALHEIRKVAALGVACMEYNGAPQRE